MAHQDHSQNFCMFQNQCGRIESETSTFFINLYLPGIYLSRKARDPKKRCLKNNAAASKVKPVF